MSTEFGNNLNPFRKLNTPKGVKANVTTVVITLVKSDIGPGGILSIEPPHVGDDNLIVPGSMYLCFTLDLNSAAGANNDPNRTIANNVGRIILNKIEVKIGGQSVYTLNDSDIFLCYQDLWKTTNERKNAIYQGIQSEAVGKIRMNAGDKGTAVEDVALGEAYGNSFRIPLDFELLSTHAPFFPSEFKDKLSFELTFNNYNRVIVSSDTSASYTISNLRLKFKTVNSPELAHTLRNQYRGKSTVLYERIIRYSKLSLNKSDTIWNIKMEPQAKSIKGILILFIDPADGGANYARDSEKFYNPKIKKVSVALGGKPNQLFASGMEPCDHFDENINFLGDGKFSPVPHIIKYRELSDITVNKFVTTKYGLFLDMRSTVDNTLHGSGKKIEGPIRIEIEKKAETAGNLDAYVYYIQDAQLNFEAGRLINVIY
jgi:hypothetical protein